MSWSNCWLTACVPCTYFLKFVLFFETEPLLTASRSAHRFCDCGNAEKCITSPSPTSPPVRFKLPLVVKATSRLQGVPIWHYQLSFPPWSIEGSNTYRIALQSRNPKDLYKAFSPGCVYLEFMPPTPCQFPVHSLPRRMGMKHAVAKSSSNLTNLWQKTVNVHQLDDQDTFPPHSGQFNVFWIMQCLTASLQTFHGK